MPSEFFDLVRLDMEEKRSVWKNHILRVSFQTLLKRLFEINW